jgi:hypothetical protein
MRHFLLSGTVTALSLGVGVTTAQTGLIAATGGTNRMAASLVGTLPGAVAVATITVAANKHGRAAAGAQVASSRMVHWQSGPMGNRRRRALRGILCRQRRRCWGCGVRHRNLLGSGDRCRACVSTGRSDFYRIGNADATATTSTEPLRPIPAARVCQTTACCAIRPPEALRAANRKTGIDMPDSQNQNHRFAYPLRITGRRQISAERRHRSHQPLNLNTHWTNPGHAVIRRGEMPTSFLSFVALGRNWTTCPIHPNEKDPGNWPGSCV